MTPAKTEMANNPERMNDMSADYEGNRNEFSSVTAMINDKQPKEGERRRKNRLFSDMSSIHQSPRA